DAAVALHDTDDGQSHPRIAGRALDDRAARLEHTGLLGVFDHLDGHAVLDRVAGIEGLDLGEHGGVDALRDPVDPHHRGVADRIQDGVADLLARRPGLGLHRGRVGLHHFCSHTPSIRRTATSSPIWYAL